MLKNYLLFVCCFFFLLSCDKDDDATSINPENEEDTISNPIDTLVNPVDTTNVSLVCDSTKRPIVFLHGFLASGDTYASQFKRFSSNLYCDENLFVFDWNSLDQTADNIGNLSNFIDEVIEKTGFEKIDLAGHSAGSGLCYNYLSTSENAQKIAHYVHLGGNPEANIPNENVPTMNIWSAGDLVVLGGNITNAENIELIDKDHYEVATSEETFEVMYEFFNDTLPETLTIVEQETISVAGKALSFGENIANANATINIYELNEVTGYRIDDSPNFSTITDENGSFEPIEILKNKHYEFEVISAISDDRVVHYYREPFLRSDYLVYLRTIPSSVSLASILLSGLPSDDTQSVLAFYSSSKAVISGRDNLLVNNIELSTPDFCSAENTTIAMFYYDGNNNQTSDIADIGGVWAAVPVFLAAVDFFFPTENDESITVNFNGRQLVMPNFQSASEGIMIAQFN